jgi:3-methyladenine DNA glycosylase AlkD
VPDIPPEAVKVKVQAALDWIAQAFVDANKAKAGMKNFILTSVIIWIRRFERECGITRSLRIYPSSYRRE